MAYYFPEGSLMQFSTTLAAAKTITGISNANPGVASATAHGYSDNDEVLLETGWSDVNETIFKVDQLTADTYSFLEFDSSNTSFYPSGSGGGTSRKLSAWTTVPQLLDISTQGGDARFTPIQLLANRNDIQVATGFNPTSINFTLAHDPANATVKEMLRLSRTLSKVAIKILISGSAPMYGYGYITMSELPQMARNQVNRLGGVVTLGGRPTLYAS